MSRTFAYCRVSTTDQTTDNQVLAIQEAGHTVTKSRTITEQISGKVCAMQRPEFIKLVDKLEADDKLVVVKLDRLGRDTSDVLSTLALLKAKGVQVICLALGSLDLNSAAGTMTLTVLAAVAQFERDLLVERTQAGLERAKAEGKTLGRPTVYDDAKATEIREAIAKGMSLRNAAKAHGVSLGTVQRIMAA
ncbi:recombinase family protein [Chitinibacter bivalviorum]|uniref:Recombinase family protein n=1 Tax=Chitinibacter bivalviorum TaxID=2739434 RepID=A0A7H9BEC4_9NEIS|nr:recombinase family protein [Chitinibacter bivalviorum]QLG87073.1 recombinase family protein [Chitinibacter bivalviorum]